MLLAPVVCEQKGEFRDVIERLAREGFVRARVDGELVELSSNVRVKLEPKQRHTIEAVGGPPGDRRQNSGAPERFGGDGAQSGAKGACCFCSSRAMAAQPGDDVRVDGVAAFQSELQPGHRGEFRPADAETFFVQFAAGGVSGLPRAGAEDGVRRASDRAGRGEIAGKGRGAAVAARRQADDRLLQGAIARHGRSITGKAWKRPGRICRRISRRKLLRGTGAEEIEFTFWRAGKMSNDEKAVRRDHPQSGAPLCRERKRVHQKPIERFHEPAALRRLRRPPAQARNSRRDAREAGTASSAAPGPNSARPFHHGRVRAVGRAGG